MRRVTIAVIGNAKTTRANVEALIGDVVDSVDEATIVTVYDQKQSDAQIWAKQYAEDKSITFLEYAENDYDTLVSKYPAEELRFFVLWDDEDPECQLAASEAQRRNIPVFDLTDGLMRIKLSDATIPKPATASIPAQEAIPAEEPEVEEDSEDALEDVPELADAIVGIIEEAVAEFTARITADLLRLIKG